MVQDQMLRKSNTSKSKKPKKEPQRGLGVAQLERLRLEEQRKANNAHSSASSSAISFHNSFPGLQLQSSYNSPVPQPFLHQASPSSAIWQCHNFSNWRHQLPLPQASVPLMSSGYVPWLEPPSNQIFCSDSNSTLVSLGDGREITGMKRAPHLPFSLDSLANPFSTKIPIVSGLVKVHGSLPFGNDSFGFGATTATFSASCKTIQREHNETCDGDFLTLGITNSLPYSKQIPVERAPPAHLCKESNDVFYTVSNSEVSRNLSESQNFYIFLPMGPTFSEKPPQEQLPPVPDDLDLNLKL